MGVRCSYIIQRKHHPFTSEKKETPFAIILLSRNQSIKKTKTKKMFKYFALGAAAVMAQDYTQYAPVDAVAPAMPAMDPMMMMMLMGDDSSSMKDMLPLMMMQGGQQMDPMMMMMLMGDDSSSMKDLLPLMMMNGGAAGAP